VFELRGGTVFVVVADTWSGLQADVFDDPDTRLYALRRAVEAANGTLTVSVGDGAVVTMTLPVTSDDQE
jgi:hypothetical protein